MSARRCAECDINWPVDAAKYAHCPSCQEATEWDADARGLESGPAADLAKMYRDRNRRRREFELFYEEREVEILRGEMDAWLAAQLC